MQSMLLIRFLFTAFILLLFPHGNHPSKKEKDKKNVQDYFFLEKKITEKGYDGVFVIYDPKQDLYISTNSAKAGLGYLPASTFKILNTLIGLESGLIADENFIIPWDGKERSIAEWNKDHTLRSAFKASCVPYYQELARRVGKKQMKHYVTLADYGEMHIKKKNIDRFWLTGKSRITAFEQVDFLKRMYNYELPFSKRNVDILKDIMFVKNTFNSKLYGKTGLNINEADSLAIGWFVGYIENSGYVYYFATLITAQGPDINKFMQDRKDITDEMLKEVGVY